MSNPIPERCTEFGVDCIFVKQSASISPVPTWTSRPSGRALHCCNKNAFNSIRVVLRVDPLRLIIPSAAEESQQWLQHPLPLLPQAHAFTGSTECSDQLTFAIAECDRWLDAVIGYQPNFLRNHDAVPLTLKRSASPSQSESPHVNTEPTGTPSHSFQIEFRRPHCHDSRVSRLELIFLMSASLARPRLDEAFAAQRKSARSIHISFSTGCR